MLVRRICVEKEEGGRGPGGRWTLRLERGVRGALEALKQRAWGKMDFEAGERGAWGALEAPKQRAWGKMGFQWDGEWGQREGGVGGPRGRCCRRRWRRRCRRGGWRAGTPRCSAARARETPLSRARTPQPRSHRLCSAERLACCCAHGGRALAQLPSDIRTSSGGHPGVSGSRTLRGWGGGRDVVWQRRGQNPVEPAIRGRPSAGGAPVLVPGPLLEGGQSVSVRGICRLWQFLSRAARRRARRYRHRARSDAVRADVMRRRNRASALRSHGNLGRRSTAQLYTAHTAHTRATRHTFAEAAHFRDQGLGQHTAPDCGSTRRRTV